MADGLNETMYDTFCNCIKQIQSVDPGVALNLNKISPEFAFNAKGVLVYISTGEAVNLEESRKAAFDPNEP